MICCKKQAGRKYYGKGFSFSPKLKQAADNVFKTQKNCQLCSTE